MVDRRKHSRRKPGQLHLTDVQLRIVELAGQGASNDEIAYLINKSERTVKWYWEKLCAQLDAKNSRQVIYKVAKTN